MWTSVQLGTVVMVLTVFSVTHRGDWYFPNGTILSLSGDMYEVRGAQRVVLRHTTATGPTGIYRCDIATNSVHNNTENSVRDTVYVALYTTGEGSYS